MSILSFQFLETEKIFVSVHQNKSQPRFAQVCCLPEFHLFSAAGWRTRSCSRHTAGTWWSSWSSASQPQPLTGSGPRRPSGTGPRPVLRPRKPFHISPWFCLTEPERIEAGIECVRPLSGAAKKQKTKFFILRNLKSQFSNLLEFGQQPKIKTNEIS